MKAGRKRAGAAPNLLAAWSRVLDQRPILVALAGSNGAGKTTFYHAHFKPAGLRFLNAAEAARELKLEAYEAAAIVAELRQELVRQQESFIWKRCFPIAWATNWPF